MLQVINETNSSLFCAKQHKMCVALRLAALSCVLRFLAFLASCVFKRKKFLRLPQLIFRLHSPSATSPASFLYIFIIIISVNLNTMITSPLSVAKIIVLGESGVGKTSLILQYTTHKFTDDYVPTSVPDFFTADVRVDDKRKLVQLWDSSGKQRWHQNTGTQFYQGIDGCVLVCSADDPSSFERLEFWRSFFISHARVSNNTRKNFPFIVVCNKSDLIYNKAIKNDIEAWGVAKNIPVFFSSSKSAKNVNLAMDILLHKIEDKDFVYVNDRKARKRSKQWAKYLTLFQMSSIALFSLYLYYSNGGLDDFIVSINQLCNK